MQNKIIKNILNIIIALLVVFATYFFIFGYYLPSIYNHKAEWARQAEARGCLSKLSTACISTFKTSKNIDSTIEKINKELIGSTEGVPGPKSNNCISGYYFYYFLKKIDDSKVAIVAARCVAGGKEPQGIEAYNLELITDCSTGEETLKTSFSKSTRVPYSEY